MLTKQIRLLKYVISNSRISMTAKDVRNDKYSSFYPVIGLTEAKLGACSLNIPNNRNLLNSQCIDELYKYILSYNHDHSVQNIWIQHRDGFFSGGADFEQLASNPHYLRKIFLFSEMLGKVNKPIIAKVGGPVRGIAAYLLKTIPGGIGTIHANLRLDQTQRGFIPIFGGSHRLSKMPFNVGLYLALTGQKINYDVMARLGFLNAFTRAQTSNNEIRKNITRSNLFFRNTLPQWAQDQQFNQISTSLLNHRKRQNLNVNVIVQYRQMIQNRRNFSSKLAMLYHKINTIFHANQVNPTNTFTMSDGPGRNIINYYQHRLFRPMYFLRQKQLIQICQYKQSNIQGLQVNKIITTFGKNTLEQIIDTLQKDGSEWAKKTLQQIKSKDPLATKLTFYLIKNAENKSWLDCLETQYQVASKLIKNSQLSIQQYFDGSRFIFKNKYSNQDLSSVSNAIIQQYTKIDENLSKLSQTPKDSFLPVVDFYDLPDNPRSYLNQVMFDDPHYRNHVPQIIRYLNKNRIDYRSKTYNVPQLRNAIFKSQSLKNEFIRQQNRLIYTTFNENLKNIYINRIKEHLSIKKERVSEIIKEIFDEQFKGRYDALQQTARLAGLENKLQIFKNVRQSMYNTIILDGDNIENKRFQQNPIFEGILYFDKKGKGVFQSDNDAFTNNQHLNAFIKQLREKPIDQKLRTSKQFHRQHGRKSLPQHIGINNFKDPEAQRRQKLFQQLKFRYDRNARIDDKAREYRYLLQRAGQTSEQLAGMLEWSDQDFMNVIRNAPAPELRAQNFAKIVSKNLTQNYGKQKRNLKRVSQAFEKIKQQKKLQFDNLIDNQDYNVLRQYPFLYSKNFLPEAFRQKYLPLLTQVVSNFAQKYFDQGKTIPVKKQLGKIDEYFNTTIQSDFTQFVEADTIYVFSYLVILQMRELLYEIGLNGGVKSIPNLSQYLFQKYRLKFQDNQPRVINSKLVRFLYDMLDHHTQAKNSILFPQTKLLDYVNRLRIKWQKQKRYNTSFENLMLLIARQRRRILNRINNENPVLGTEPEFSLAVLYKQTKECLDIQDVDISQLDSRLQVFKQLVQKNHIPVTKRLLLGFQYYLFQFDKILQKVGGSENFLPEQLRDCRNKQDQLKIMKSIFSFSETPEAWVDRNLKDILRQVFQHRKKIEKTMSKGQLILYDQGLKQILKPQLLSASLENLLYYQIGNIQSQSKLLKKEQKIKDKFRDQMEIAEEVYLRKMHQIRNHDALRRLNNAWMAKRVQKNNADQMANIDDEEENENQDEDEDEDEDPTQNQQEEKQKLIFFKSQNQVHRQMFNKTEQFQFNKTSLTRIAHEIYSTKPQTPQLSKQELQTFKKRYMEFDNNEEKSMSLFMRELLSLKSKCSNIEAIQSIQKIYQRFKSQK